MKKMRYLCASAALLFFSATLANGQVFTQADGAVEGPTQPGVGQALYGGMGLNSASDPEFEIYRKYLRRETDEPLSSATNVANNPGEMEWTNVNQRQGLTADAENFVLTAPGMFIGQKNHVTEDGWVVSNPNEVLYFKPLIDNQEDAALTDSNRNAFWDARFGFMESPDDYIDFVNPNSEQLDLWTGQFNTDAVYMQAAVSRDDSVSDQVLARSGHGGSFKLQSGSEDTQVADERNRDNYEAFRTVAGTDDELERTGFVDAGVAYADPVEITWGMRLNDPEAGDEIEAREVAFWLKVGNVVSEGIFDPGADGEFTDFPPNSQDAEDFTDFFFDWQNAKPVFFAGAQGQVQGTGSMGIFIPGDLGADGAVDVDDFARLAASFGDSGTTYSNGDITQDGLTDIADLTAWGEAASDTVKSEAIASLSDMNFDFDGSGSADAADVAFLTDLFGVATCTTGNGDFDGNGRVEFADFLVLSNNFGQDADAASGDIDCNGRVEFADFLVLSNNFGQSVGAEASSVPEPSGLALLTIALTALGLVRRRR